MDEYEVKGIVVTVKDDADSPGTVVASFAAFDEIDRDGEITRPDAFGTQKVLLGAYGHSSFGRMGAPTPPVGIGEIREEKGQGIFTGQFNLEMMAGKETFESVKMAGPLQQWSYGFQVLKESFDTVRGQRVRVLEKMKVHEVSPVMIGAGTRTRTLDIKEATEAFTLEEHSDHALAAWTEYLNRLKALADLRAKDGRILSAANRSRLSKLGESLREIDAAIAKLLEDTDAPDKSAALSAYLEFQKTQSRINGVAIGA